MDAQWPRLEPRFTLVVAPKDSATPGSFSEIEIPE
jgi:hypothetical protein